MWNLPELEIKLMSPALAGEFFTTEPPGSPRVYILILCFFEKMNTKSSWWSRIWFLIKWMVGCLVSILVTSTQLITEKAMAPHSSTLAWKVPWTKDPGRLQSMRLLRIGHDWATSLSLFTFKHWTQKWQPTPVFFPGESQGRGNLVGWGRTVGHDWSDLAAAAADYK